MRLRAAGTDEHTSSRINPDTDATRAATVRPRPGIEYVQRRLSARAILRQYAEWLSVSAPMRADGNRCLRWLLSRRFDVRTHFRCGTRL